MNNNIVEFFTERKSKRIKDKIKSQMDLEMQGKILQEIEEEFSLPNWVLNAAKRVKNLSMTSHYGKFTHPNAKTSPVFAKNSFSFDGYLRTGNTEYELDVFCSASIMDVYKFLSLKMDDDKDILTHFEENTEMIKSAFSFLKEDYENCRKSFIAIKQPENVHKTDFLVKQVYFPVADNYHLLSILTPSGILTKIKKYIDKLKFSDETKNARECYKKNEYHGNGYEDIFDLTIIKYGGNKPQNISCLNAKNGGRAYLLSSFPPMLKVRNIRLPNKNFFKNSLRIKEFKENFQELHKLICCDVNNKNIRAGIINILKFIIDQILQKAFDIRAFKIGWSETEHYQSLSLAQKIWLDDAYLEQRENTNDWIDEISISFGRWIIKSYEFSLKDSCIKLSDDELQYISTFTKKAIDNDREFFK